MDAGLMRRALLLGCALVALQSVPAVALTEPDQMLAKDSGGDDRVRQAYWRPGKVIQVVAAQGQSLVVEMPKGMAVDGLMLSEQTVMTPEKYAEECTESVDNTTGQVVKSCAPPKAVENKEENCTRSVDLKLCWRRDRFLFFIPFGELDAQPLPILMIEKKKAGKREEEIEHSIIFQISTVAANERPYFAVRVIAGEPPQPPQPPKPAVTAVPSTSLPTVVQPPYRPSVTIPAKPGMPKRDRDRLRELERANAPPPVVNDKYILQGDENLIGR